jgi:hypothetical protein
VRSLAARLSLLVALVGAVACAKAETPPSTPVATRTPRPGTPGVEQELSYEQRLNSECPPETRRDCVKTMLALLRSSSDLGRVALCTDRSGNWLERHQKGARPEQELPSDARVGDRCPDALPYAIRGIYVQERAR